MKNDNLDSVVKRKLNELGYKQLNDIPYSRIALCDAWYCNEPIKDFHMRKTLQGEPYELNRLNFAKRLCSDEANLCEMVEINAGNNKSQFKQVKKIFEDNNFSPESVKFVYS